MKLLLLACFGLVLVAMSACGGGDSALAGGVGSGGSGVVNVSVAEGSITGFGSVIVDGTEYDDSSATAQAEDGTGMLRNAELKLGQRVRLQLDGAGKVQSVHVLAQLSGPITAAPDANDNLRVLGQSVRLSGSTSDPSRGVVAQVAGFGSLAPRVADEVEMHGSWVFDASTSRYVLLANRMEKLPSSAASVQLSGVVTRIAGSTLVLNSASGLSVSAASVPDSVAVGSLVRVWATRTAWTAYAAAPAGALQATRVVNATALDTTTGDQKLRVAGPIANFDATTRTVEIAGVRVAVPASIKVEDAQLAPGQMVSLEVQRKGNMLVMDSAVTKGAVGTPLDLGQTVKTKAIVSGVAWNGSPVSFTLRGVKWLAAQPAIANSCRIATVADDVLVTALGRAQAGSETVAATDVQCVVMPSSIQTSSATTATTERSGKVGSVDVKAQRFTLQSAKGDIAVNWDSQTYFSDGFSTHPESLTGQSVEVEGVTTSGVLRARKVKRAD